jgi:hypothetical protein
MPGSENITPLSMGNISRTVSNNLSDFTSLASGSAKTQFSSGKDKEEKKGSSKVRSS